MTHGSFRDGFPRLILHLPQSNGRERSIEFILDSGFEGDLALPSSLLVGLEAVYVGEHPFALADLTYRTRPIYQIILDWHDEERVTEVISIKGNPLLGIGLLRDNLVQIEITEGGEVSVEPL